ncbi:MAG: dipeptidase PepE [Terriglobales bacterium]
MKRVLLISNSTLHGSGYLDHAESEIRDFLGRAMRIAFVPYAAYERGRYAAQARARFQAMGCEVTSLHDVSNPRRALAEAEAVFVGGGNTFRLLKAFYDSDLLEPIRRAVEAGVPYIGSSAGAIVAGPSLRTTKDMPVVQPPSFAALGLVDFQISPHYLDPDPSSTHMGETQEERILQFLEENEAAVVGLREGAMLRIENDAVTLKGSAGARLFRRGEEPVEASPVAELSGLLLETAGVAQ